jgi:zinc transport system substrate-binding protein
VEVGGKAPTLKQMKQLVDQARQDDVRIIFVQPQFEPKAAEAVARELDGAVVKVDPLNRNVLESLQSIADRLEEAFTETREQP